MSDKKTKERLPLYIKERLPLYITAEQNAWIKKKADSLGCTKSQYVVQLINKAMGKK